MKTDFNGKSKVANYKFTESTKLLNNKKDREDLIKIYKNGQRL